MVQDGDVKLVEFFHIGSIRAIFFLKSAKSAHGKKRHILATGIHFALLFVPANGPPTCGACHAQADSPLTLETRTP
jgi:hypothetical protein